MGEEFTFQNVRIVVQAVANHLKKKFPNIKISVVVNYDTRFLSERFAFEAAKVLSNNKIHVFLADRDSPSQAQANQIIKRRAQGGINFTASFNPPEYNGLKYNTENGAPALPEETDMIEDEIKLLNKESLIIPYYPRTEFVEKIDFQTDYLSLLQERIDFDLIRKSKIRVAADSLYGTSREYLDGILEENHVPVEEIHGYIDPYFGGIAPSSTEENLTELKDLVRKKKCHIGIATDCDGDRFGVVDERGRFVDPNLVLSLILDYLVTQKKWRGGVARSVATTHLIDQIARRFELPVYKTPVGFKFIAELFLEDKIIFGGEESACFALKDHLPEKDGIIAGLLLVEILAAMGKTISELIDDLFKKYGRKVGRQVSINLTSENERRLKNLINNPIKQLGDRKIINIETIDGIKLDFSDDDWILFRLSGTEPLIRFYVEAGNKKELDKLMKLGIERIV